MNAKQRDALIATLRSRFDSYPQRHAGIRWEEVEQRLRSAPAKLEVLARMEASGGEPDVIGSDPVSGGFTFCDCAEESPKGRRGLCYDGAALEARKVHKPKGSAVDAAAALGVELLTEDDYRDLQQLDAFDTKTSSWIRTPEAIRKLGGALFADRRYDHVFVYHNGAQSYYAVRGFRGVLRV